MKTLVLVLISLPVVSLAQGPAQPETATPRVASNSNKPSIEGRDVASRSTATSAMASRADTAPVLDGKSDDPAWQEAQGLAQFAQDEAKKGAETRFKGEVGVTFDGEN